METRAMVDVVLLPDGEVNLLPVDGKDASPDSSSLIVGEVPEDTAPSNNSGSPGPRASSPSLALPLVTSAAGTGTIVSGVTLGVMAQSSPISSDIPIVGFVDADAGTSAAAAPDRAVETSISASGLAGTFVPSLVVG